jgi:hypothetical protein
MSRTTESTHRRRFVLVRPGIDYFYIIELQFSIHNEISPMQPWICIAGDRAFGRKAFGYRSMRDQTKDHLYGITRPMSDRPSRIHSHGPRIEQYRFVWWIWFRIQFSIRLRIQTCIQFRILLRIGIRFRIDISASIRNQFPVHVSRRIPIRDRITIAWHHI